MKNGTTTKVAPAPQKEDNDSATGAPRKKKTRKQELQEQATRNGIDHTGKTTGQLTKELKELKKQGVFIDGRQENGGHENVGPKTIDDTDPTLAAARAMHLNEEIDLTMLDPNAPGGKRKVRRQSMLAVLDQLRQDALKTANTPQARTAAAHEYLDRTLGKAAQEFKLKHSGEIGTFKAKRPSKAAEAGIDAYERAILAGKGR